MMHRHSDVNNFLIKLISFVIVGIVKIQAEEEEYAKAVNVTAGVSTLPTDDETDFFGISGGEKAQEAEFPHMALIGYGTLDEIKWDCGGTLISEQYVMTAGHCLFSKDWGPARYVRLGVTNRNDVKYRKEFTIIERIKHPDYTPTSYYNDIALIKLNSTVTLSPYLRPACLYKETSLTKSKAIATGWGKTEYTEEGSDDLFKVELEFIDQNRCNNSYSKEISRKLKNGIVESIQVCAGSYSERKNTCQGDSGGPLQIYGEKSNTKCTYLIVGVTSFGKPCEYVKGPGIYTRVSAYVKWLEDTV